MSSKSIFATVISIAVAIFLPWSVFSYSSRTANTASAVTYLESTQLRTGGWGDGASARDTATVVAALRMAQPGSPALKPAAAWLQNRPARTNADRARIIAALGGRFDTSSLATALIANQNLTANDGQSAPPIYSDDFSAATGDWRSGGFMCKNAEYTDGELRIIPTDHPFNPDCWFFTTPSLSDLDVEVQAHQDTARTHISYGVIFRGTPGAASFGTDNSFYSFEIDPTAGAYFVGRQAGGVKTALVDWTPSPVINHDQTANLLRVVAKGSHVQVFVNNQALATLDDSTFTEGKLGLIVRDLDKSLKPLSARFDNFAVYRSRDFSEVTPNGSDGGWGVNPGYASDSLHTALALAALKVAGVSGDGLARGVRYLTAAQNGDGGWGMNKGSASDPALTAQVMLALTGYATEPDVITALTKSTQYLVSQQHGNGGWGATGSTVAESALVYYALRSQSVPDSVKQAAVAYLEGTQGPDGSWNDQPYDTALAVLALGTYPSFLPIIVR